MTPADLERIEGALGVQLPPRYVTALESHGLSGDWSDHPEFTTDATELLALNTHFVEDPDDLSDLRKPGLLGTMQFWLRYGSGDRLRAYRRRMKAQWADKGRFVIGSDLSEERYFITLRDDSDSVYAYSLESRRSRKIADSLRAWIEVARDRQEKAAREP